MSIRPNSVGKRSHYIVQTKQAMMGRVMETLWDKIQYMDHGINSIVDSEAIFWYRLGTYFETQHGN